MGAVLTGARIERRRLALNMTRSALARAAALSSSSAVRAIETGQRAVTLQVLGRIALALDTTVADLFQMARPADMWRDSQGRAL